MSYKINASCWVRDYEYGASDDWCRKTLDGSVIVSIRRWNTQSWFIDISGFIKSSHKVKNKKFYSLEAAKECADLFIESVGYRLLSDKQTNLM